MPGQIQQKVKAKKSNVVPVLRRYTNLGATIRLLQTGHITLLNPATWDDKNDSYFMSEFKRLKKVKTVLALCFAQSKETYHHWRVFSDGTDGVCIEFDKNKLLTTFSEDNRILRGKMNYEYIGTLEKRSHIDVDNLPFLKRKPYEDERSTGLCS
jgi:hypothetical protein